VKNSIMYVVQYNHLCSCPRVYGGYCMNSTVDPVDNNHGDHDCHTLYTSYGGVSFTMGAESTTTTEPAVVSQGVRTRDMVCLGRTLERMLQLLLASFLFIVPPLHLEAALLSCHS